MHPFSTGDLVVCVNDTPLNGYTPPRVYAWPKVGRAYRIDDAVSSTCGSGKIEYGVVIWEIPHQPPSQGWYAWRFRRIERADDCFVSVLRTLRVNASFKEAVQQTVAWHRRRWAAPGGFVQGRAEHVERLLTSYGEWFRDVFACYPDAAHVRFIADRMFTWRSERIEETPGMNPWVVPADFPALCRTALPVCATNTEGSHA